MSNMLHLPKPNKHIFSEITLSTLSYLPPSSVYKVAIYTNPCETFKMMSIAMQFVNDCLKSHEPAAYLKNMPNHFSKPTYTNWFSKYKPHFESLIDCELSDFKDYLFKTELTCFFEAKNEIPIYTTKDLLLHSHGMHITCIQEKLNTLNSFISLIRQKMNMPKLKAALRKSKQQSLASFKSCKKLIQKVQSLTSNVLIVKLDLALTPDINILINTCHPFHVKTSFHSEHSLKILKSHIAHFLKNKRHNKILNLIIGYIFKFDHNPNKGFYAHAIFFIDGTTSHTKNFFENVITYYWYKITTKTGCTYTFDSSKEIYKKQPNILLLIEYFCQAEQCYLFKPLAKYRTLQVSQIRTVKSPRHHTESHHFSTAE